jgi:hypothetical protein
VTPGRARHAVARLAAGPVLVLGLVAVGCAADDTGEATTTATTTTTSMTSTTGTTSTASSIVSPVGEPILTYVRAGGSPPRDDESLEVDADGNFRLRRTIGTTRVGEFGGTLPPSEAAALRQAAAGLDDVPAPDETDDARTPGAPTESIETISGAIVVASDAEQPAAIAALFDTVRALTDDLVEFPLAAIELTARRTPPGASLRSVGATAATVDLASLTTLATVTDADGRTLQTWSSPPSTVRAPEPAAEGWTRDLALDASRLDRASARGNRLTVRVELGIVDAGGLTRTVGLTVVAS